MRIQKYLSEQGICSRREAEMLVDKGYVLVNGVAVVGQGRQIDPAVDTVTLAPEAEKFFGNKTSVIINKPRGISSSRIPEEGENIYDMFPQFATLNVVGRLDKMSEGLLLISNDGIIAKAVTGDEHRTEKEYRVTVREDVNKGRLKKLDEGIELPDGKTLPVETIWEDEHTFRIIMREGRKHQIRRMCEYLKLTVTSLTRLRIGSITLDNLPVGSYHILTPKEVASLKNPIEKKKSVA